MIDARYVDASLTYAGQLVAKTVTDTIADLEVDVHEAAGADARYGFSRVAWMLAAMDDESDAYRPLLEAEGLEADEVAVEGLDEDID